MLGKLFPSFNALICRPEHQVFYSIFIHIFHFQKYQGLVIITWLLFHITDIGEKCDVTADCKQSENDKSQALSRRVSLKAEKAQ